MAGLGPGNPTGNYSTGITVGWIVFVSRSDFAKSLWDKILRISVELQRIAEIDRNGDAAFARLQRRAEREQKGHAGDDDGDRMNVEAGEERAGRLRARLRFRLRLAPSPLEQRDQA